jgi:hypothetical protein
MRYLVDRGTGTIVPLTRTLLNGDLVIVDVGHDEFNEADILELADKARYLDKAIIGNAYDVPMDISDTGISNELNDYVSNWSYVDVEIGETDSYGYCLANPDTWPLIRDLILNDVALWSEYGNTFAHAVITVANQHNGVAE